MRSVAEPRAVTLRWRKIYRTVAAKHPPVNVFEHIVDPQQMEAAWYIESLTNDRLRDESGVAPVVPEADRVRGPNASIGMAAFTHSGRPSRCSDGPYGVSYAARARAASIRDTA